MKKNTSWKFMDESSVTFQSSVSGPGEFGHSVNGTSKNRRTEIWYFSVNRLHHQVQSHWYNGHSRKAVASSQDVTIEKSSLGGKNFKIQPSPQPQKTTSPAENLEYQTTTENKSEQKNQNVEVRTELFSFLKLLSKVKFISKSALMQIFFFPELSKTQNIYTNNIFEITLTSGIYQ